MKTTLLLATLIAAALPLTAVLAEDPGKPGATTEMQGQGCGMMGMKGTMHKGQMTPDWKAQDAELDQLVAEMNGAPADKKLDAVAAVVTKLVEQRKLMHEQMRTLVTANEKEGMEMCRMMMGMSAHNGGEHSPHH
jgi:Spy/CpxP family protein refolding chaperone